MISMLSSSASHYWLAPHQLKSSAQLASLEEESGVRKARVPQTREIYLHPSQIFSPPPECESAQSYPPYFPSFDPNNDVAYGHPISLPPILTFDEIEAESLRSSPMAMEEMPPSQYKNVTGRATNEHADTKIIVQNHDPSSVAHQHVHRQPSWSGLHENLNSSYHAFSGPAYPSQHQIYEAQPAGLYSTFFPTGTIENYHSQPASFFQYGTQPDHDTSLPAISGSFAYSDAASQLANASPHTSPPTTSSGGHASPKQSLSADARHSDRSNTPVEVPQKRTGKLPSAVTTKLKKWLMAHTSHPYPTEEEKRALCMETGLTMNQVSNWFINARRRILPSLGTISIQGNRKHVAPVIRANIPGDRLPAMSVRSSGGGAAARIRAHPYGSYATGPGPLP